MHANRWLASLDEFDRARLKHAKVNVPEAIALIEQPDGRLRIEWCDVATAVALYEGQGERAEPSAEEPSTEEPSANNPPGFDDDRHDLP